MPDRGQHCPFLNRADRRCSEHFSLDHLTHAFEHCFDRYAICPTYLELLAERRGRRAEGNADAAGSVVVTVQLRIPKRYAQPTDVPSASAVAAA